MASLLPSNVILPEPIADMVRAMVTEKSAFASNAAVYAAGAEMGGDFYRRVRWDLDTVAPERIDGSASTPDKVGNTAEIAPIVRLKRSRAIVDSTEAALGVSLAGTPRQELINGAAAYWAKAVDNLFGYTLTALFDPSTGVLRTTHTHDVSVGSGSAVSASFSAMVDAGTKLGDNYSDLRLAVMHSKVWADLRKEVGARATYIPLGDAMIPYYDGLRVYLHDSVITSGSGTYKKYWTFLLRPTALFMGVQRDMREIVEINATVPETRITQTLHVGCGVEGIKWTSTTANPSDVELSDPSNWAKATSDDKAIGVIALVTNAS